MRKNSPPSGCVLRPYCSHKFGLNMDLFKFLPDFMFLNLQMGTCYTAEECEDNSGTASGSCADGYGVCCICKCSRHHFKKIQQLLLQIVFT